MIRGFSLVLRIHDYHSLILSIIDQSILYVIENVFVSIKDGFTLHSGPLQRDATVSKSVLHRSLINRISFLATSSSRIWRLSGMKVSHSYFRRANENPR